MASAHPMSTAVVIPCFNEAGRLAVAELVEFVASRPWLTVVLVNDGSTDETERTIAAAVRRAPERLRALNLSQNRGKAEAVRRGVLHAFDADPELVGFWDADLATPLADIDAFRALFEEGPERQIVMGSRVKLLGRKIERSEMRHYFGRISATVVSRTLGIPVYDTQCGAKMFRVTAEARDVFAEPFITRWIFDVEILARWLLAAGADVDVHRSIIEVPLQEWTDISGSKLRLRDFLRAPVDLWRIRRHYGPGLRSLRKKAAGMSS